MEIIQSYIMGGKILMLPSYFPQKKDNFNKFRSCKNVTEKIPNLLIRKQMH